MNRFIVIKQHCTEYPEPITFKQGAKLVIGEEYVGEEGWDNWFLCTTRGQKAGWVPAQVIERTGETTGVALEGYTASELDVNVGENLCGFRQLNGWVWCRRISDSREGWVPLGNVKEVQS